MSFRFLLFFMLSLGQFSNLYAVEPTADSQLTTPRVVSQSLGRNFGILTGDKITHHYKIAVPKGVTINTSSLPAIGNLNYWLKLDKVDYTLSHYKRYDVYHLILQYQTFYAPLDIRELTTPAQQIDFSDSTNISKVSLPEWFFTMSPLKSFTASKEDNIGFMKPDVAPKPINLTPHKNRLIILVVIALLSLLTWLWLSGLIPFFNLSPFHHAYFKLLKYSLFKPSTSQNPTFMLQQVHQAFNEKAGQTLFSYQLPDFFEQNSQFKSMSSDIKSFFKQSEQLMFMNGSADKHFVSYLKKLCRTLAKHDRVIN